MSESKKTWLDSVQTGIFVIIAVTTFASFRNSGDKSLPLIIYRFTIFTSCLMGLFWVWAVKMGRKRVDAGRNKGVYGPIYWTTGGIIVLLLSGGLGTTFFLRSERGQRFLSASASIERLVEARKGPGTDALKNAGCKQVIVISMDQAKDALASFQAEEAVMDQSNAGTLVMCDMGLSTSADIDCGSAAALYGEAEPNPRPPLFVVLQHMGVNQCVGKFNADGTPLEGEATSGMVTSLAPGKTSEP